MEGLSMALQQLHEIRGGALRVPELLGTLDRNELAAVLQGMSGALATLSSSWGQLAQKQGTLDAAAPGTGSAGTSSPTDIFEAMVTSHMIAASAAAFGCNGPSRALASLAPEPGFQASSSSRDSSAELAAIVERVRGAAPGLILVLCSSNGHMHVAPKDACEIKLGYQNVFSASVGLAGAGRLEVVRVVVDSFDKAMELDAWDHSLHQVFRRISSLSIRALVYFQKRASCWRMEPGYNCTEQAASLISRTTAEPAATATAPSCQHPAQSIGPGGTSASVPNSASLHGTVLEDLLLWLTSYRDLITRPCCVTGKLLAWDSSTQFPTLPVFRNFKLSRHQLLDMASDAKLVKAYHMHVVPEEVIDWVEVWKGHEVWKAA